MNEKQETNRQSIMILISTSSKANALYTLVFRITEARSNKFIPVIRNNRQNSFNLKNNEQFTYFETWQSVMHNKIETLIE